MKKLTRLVCVLLSAVMIFAFVACTKPQDPIDTKDSEASGSGQPSESADDSATPVVTDEYDAMGIEKDKKFNEEYLIYNWKDQIQWEFVDKENYDAADVIKSAIFRRQTVVEEKLGVTLKTELEPGSWNDRNSFIARLKASVDNNDHAYDLVGQYTCAASIGAMYGLYKPLNQTKYFNADHEWWPGDIVDSASINRNLYFVAGDISPTLIRGMGCMLVNLDMANNKGLPNFYDLVNNKQWTYDKFYETVIGANAQGNVDGSKSYSLTLPDNVVFDNLFYAGGFRFVDSDPVSGALEVSKTLEGQPIVDWYEKCQRLFWEHEDVEIVPMKNADSFVNGNSLMHLGSVADVQNYLQNVNFKFAIIPLPMRDTSQDNYNTIVGMWVSYYSIPRDARSLDLSSAVLEALGYYGREILTTTISEEVFPLRLLESEENAKIFNLLHDTLTYDTGRFFADQINVFALFRDAAKNQTKTWTVIYAQKKIWKEKIDKIITDLG